MKKKDILLFILIGIITLGFGINVQAREIIGYMKCIYYRDNGQGLGNYIMDAEWDYHYPSYGKDDTVTFAYSDLKIEDHNMLFVSGQQTWAGSVKNRWDELPASAGIFMANISDGAANTLASTFSLAMAQTTTVGTYTKEAYSCPRAFVIKGTHSEPAPVFTNNITAECGENAANCLTTTQLLSEEKIIYNNNHARFSDQTACSGANVELFVEEENNAFRLKSRIKYNGSDTYSGVFNVSYKQNGTWPSLMDHIYEFVKSGGNRISSAYMSVTKSRFVIADSEVAQKSDDFFNLDSNCSLEGGLGFRRGRAFCDTYILYMNKIEEYKNELDTKLNDLDDDMRQFLNYHYENGYSAKDFSDYDDKSALLTLVDTIDYAEIESFTNHSTNYANYLNEINNNPYLCQDAKGKVKEQSELLKKKNQDFLDMYTPFQQSLENAKARLEELGATEEETEDLDEIIDNSDLITDTINNGMNIIDQTLFDGDINLDFDDDCGLIPPKTKKWIENFLNITKICALVLALILGMIDFFRGIASGSADTMKKVWTNFSRRLIVVALLFLLPVILEFILGLVNIGGLDATNPLCGIK